jgi:hypothetical protein
VAPDLDALLTALYVYGDNCLPRRRGAGRPPRTGDAEIICQAVAQALLDCPCDRRFLLIAKCRLGHLFPKRLRQPGYHKRVRRLLPQIMIALERIALAAPSGADQLRLLDSTPIPCADSCETVRRSALAGHAGYGACAPHSRWFWGFRLYGLCTPDGMPLFMGVALVVGIDHANEECAMTAASVEVIEVADRAAWGPSRMRRAPAGVWRCVQVGRLLAEPDEEGGRGSVRAAKCTSTAGRARCVTIADLSRSPVPRRMRRSRHPVGAIEAEHLGDARTGREQQEDEGVVPPLRQAGGGEEATRRSHASSSSGLGSRSGSLAGRCRFESARRISQRLLPPRLRPKARVRTPGCAAP